VCAVAHNNIVLYVRKDFCFVLKDLDIFNDFHFANERIMRSIAEGKCGYLLCTAARRTGEHRDSIGLRLCYTSTPTRRPTCDDNTPD